MALTTPASLQRREYKYLVTEDVVAQIRQYIRGVCTTDPNAEKTGGRYLTDTLYLDTPDLASYRATIEDAGDRYKLRVRGYPSAGDAPVFFEVKRRVSEAIKKTRGFFRGDWARVLEDTSPAVLAQIEPKQRRAIDNFICHYHYTPMQPSVLVRYEREPYFSTVDEYARVTFDRHLSCQRATELTLVPEHDSWTYIDYASAQRGLSFASSNVLLELKFTSLVPSWMRAMVHTLGLQRLSFCKYSRAVDALREVPEARIARAGMFG